MLSSPHSIICLYPSNRIRGVHKGGIFLIAWILSSLNYHIKKQLFHVVTGMGTLEEKGLHTKVQIEVMGLVNVMQTEIEYLTLLLQMTLSFGIFPLIKEIFTLSFISLVMQKPRFAPFFCGSTI